MKYLVKVLNEAIEVIDNNYTFRVAPMYGNPEYHLNIPKEDVKIMQHDDDTTTFAIDYDKLFPYIHTHKNIVGLTVLDTIFDEETNDEQ
jgi:hypothetical protein